MRIGFSTSLAQRGRSGVGQYLVNLLAALIRHGARDELVIFALEPDVPLFAFARDFARLVVIRQHDGTPSHDLIWHQFTLPRLVREHALDVLHVPSQRRMLWPHPCALVTTVHDPGAFRLPRDPASRGSCPGTIFRALARRQDELLTLTQRAADELIGLGISAARVTTVRCGVDRTCFHAGPREEAATAIGRRYALHPPFFLHVGRLEHPTQNHARVIAAFNAFKTATPSPWQLVLVGPDGGGAEHIRELVLRSPYAPDIHCLGHRPREEMAAWYGVAGALVYVPLRWGFGLPPLEAMACRCPVVTTDGPMARELCGTAALYANPQDPAALQVALTQMAFDPALRTRLASLGAEHVAHLDWATSAAQTREIYARAVRRTKATVVVTPPLTTPAH